MRIEICSVCDGTGIIKENEDYRGNWAYVQCRKCNGTGRLKTLSYQIAVPFDFDETLIYQTDSKIHDLIRNLKK